MLSVVSFDTKRYCTTFNILIDVNSHFIVIIKTKFCYCNCVFLRIVTLLCCKLENKILLPNSDPEGREIGCQQYFASGLKYEDSRETKLAIFPGEGYKVLCYKPQKKDKTSIYMLKLYFFKAPKLRELHRDVKCQTGLVVLLKSCNV